MLLGVLAVVAAAPLYWALVPARHRRAAMTLASLVVLAAIDVRLPVLLAALTLGLVATSRRAVARGPVAAKPLAAAGIVLLLLLFVWHKRGGGGPAVLATQGAIGLLGASYIVLKASALFVELARGGVASAGAGEVLAWLAFLPTFPAGPITDFERFRDTRPVLDGERIGRGLERVLFGAVKAAVLARYLGILADPVLAQPDAWSPAAVAGALYATALRFYLDFAGYSDIAIGLAAIYGMTVEENFDHPFARRNLVLLWQHWHMTLTRWLRTYVFVPVSRALMRRDVGGREGPVVVAQVATMVLCGLWHGLAWHFALWGFLHALGLVWVGVVARRAGAHLPEGVVRWWRGNPVAAAVATAMTFTYFAVTLVFVVADMDLGWRILRRLVAA